MAPENPKVSQPTTTDQRNLTDPDNPNTNAWPRFLVIESTDENKSLNDVNPFIRAKALKGILGIDPKDVVFYRNSGILCVEVETRSQCKSLLKANMFHNVPIKVSPHRTKNYTKGVFSCRDLAKMTEEDILQELHDIHQPVVDIHRIMSKKTGTLKPTDTFIVTFSTSELPKDIKIGSLNVKVRPYVPNPRRCFNCQGYGHAKSKCKNRTVCAKCGQEGHEYEACTNDPHCLHCRGSHSASSKECPKYKYEKKVLELVHIEKISFYEAKQRLSALVAPANNIRLVSDVVRSDFKKIEMKSVSVQTILTAEFTHCSSCTCQGRSSTSVQTLTENVQEKMDTVTPSAQGNKRHLEKSKSLSPSKREHKEAKASSPSPRRDHKRAANAAHSPSGKGSSGPRSAAPSDGRRSRSRSPVHTPHGSVDRGRTLERGRKKLNR